MMTVIGLVTMSPGHNEHCNGTICANMYDEYSEAFKWDRCDHPGNAKCRISSGHRLNGSRRIRRQFARIKISHLS